jgi:hypothetical protein
MRVYTYGQISQSLGTYMPYINKPRPKQVNPKVGTKAYKARLARNRARYKLDTEGVDRTGKDIDHVTPLSKNGTNDKSNLKLKTPSANRSFSRNSDHTVKQNKPTAKSKK